MTSMSIVPSFNFSIGETSFQNFNKEQDFFLWYQLLIELLKQLPSTSVSQNNLLAECRLKYFDDTTQLRKIQEFEDTYDSTNVIECLIAVFDSTANGQYVTDITLNRNNFSSDTLQIIDSAILNFFFN
ncbi:unnamed protein product, partial [Rotaria sp. Silwood2]